MGKYSKTIIAAAGAVVTCLATYYGHSEWYPVLVTILTTLGVYRVPNTKK